MWNTTTEPVARPAIRNLHRVGYSRGRHSSGLLLLIVREGEAADAGVAGREGVQERQAKCSSDLQWQQ